jgi:hypothetical protein
LAHVPVINQNFHEIDAYYIVLIVVQAHKNLTYMIFLPIQIAIPLKVSWQLGLVTPCPRILVWLADHGVICPEPTCHEFSIAALEDEVPIVEGLLQRSVQHK